MDKLYVTKKKYDWVVKLGDEEFGLTEECDDAIVTAKARAKGIIAGGGEAEVYLANVVGMWDKLPLD